MGNCIDCDGHPTYCKECTDKVHEARGIPVQTKKVEEGIICPKCGLGFLYYPPVKDCTCHINPPCQKCVENTLTCTVCMYSLEEGK